MPGLGERHGISELRTALRRSEKVVYTENGNRHLAASRALQLVLPAAAKVGMTRLADISQLTFGSFPVFQSSRPGIVTHSSTGQNTGSQGKGITADQARLSCVMETIENFCMEPRNETLIRGPYDFLRNQHAICPPEEFALQNGVKSVGESEPFMWTDSYYVKGDHSVLVPAESVYFPFLAWDYSTRPVFVSTTTGVASGSTYLEATIHALYELVERHYYALWEFSKLRAHALDLGELDTLPEIQKFRQATSEEFVMEVLALRIRGVKNLPVFACWLVRPNGTWFCGSGCGPNIHIAIQRAISEAVQSYSVMESGTREDMENLTILDDSLRNFPRTRSLTLAECKKTMHDKYFCDLAEEYQFLIRWLRESGFPTVFIANLSRHGVDVPVVRALVPGLCKRVKRGYGFNGTMADVFASRFRYEE